MNPKQQRRWLAEQAARYMNEFAMDDPRAALRRVLERHGGHANRRLWPEPEEILSALRDYQRLFRGDDQQEQLQLRRDAALEAMRFFKSFRPLLTGATLEGTADTHSPVQLHLHTDEPELLLVFLQDHDIVHRIDERRIHLTAQQQTAVPHISFDADGLSFELLVLPLLSQRQAPLAADARTPIRRAGPGEVKRLANPLAAK